MKYCHSNDSSNSLS